MIDIVVSFDTTGSMSPAIYTVRREVRSLVEKLFSTVTDLRMGVISHGDYCDGDKVINVLPLTETQHDITEFITKAPNTGGGDSDECYELVLNTAKSFNWREDAKKALILIGDAQPHEVGYTYGGVRVSVDWRNLARDLPLSGITVYPVQCLGRSDPRKFYKTLAAESGVTLLTLHQFANIVPMLTALIFSQQSEDTTLAYVHELQTAGMFNTSIANIIDQVLGKRTFSVVTEVSDLDLVKADPWRFQVLSVDSPIDIKSFVTLTGAEFRRGKGFYQLTKPEMVQERKEVILYKDGDYFTGKKAREMISLPYGMRGVISPIDVPPGYTAFIQSTSTNRKLMAHTRFLYDTTRM